MALLGAFLAASVAFERRSAQRVENDGFAVVNGWILKESDLRPRER